MGKVPDNAPAMLDAEIEAVLRSATNVVCDLAADHFADLVGRMRLNRSEERLTEFTISALRLGASCNVRFPADLNLVSLPTLTENTPNRWRWNSAAAACELTSLWFDGRLTLDRHPVEPEDFDVLANTCDMRIVDTVLAMTPLSNQHRWRPWMSIVGANGFAGITVRQAVEANRMMRMPEVTR